MGRKSLPAPFDFVTVITDLIVPAVSLSVKMDLVLSNVARFFVANSNIQTLPALVVWCGRHWVSISNFERACNLQRKLEGRFASEVVVAEEIDVACNMGRRDLGHASGLK